jgi:hypothetical protein
VVVFDKFISFSMTILAKPNIGIIHESIERIAVTCLAVFDQRGVMGTQKL